MAVSRNWVFAPRGATAKGGSFWSATMSGSPYRVAIIGTGGIAFKHAAACSLSDRLELVAACNRSKHRLGQMWVIDAAYQSIDSGCVIALEKIREIS